MKSPLLIFVMIASAISILAGPSVIVAAHGGEFSSCAVNECSDCERDHSPFDLVEFAAILQADVTFGGDGYLCYSIEEPLAPLVASFQLAHSNRGPPNA